MQRAQSENLTEEDYNNIRTELADEFDAWKKDSGFDKLAETIMKFEELNLVK